MSKSNEPLLPLTPTPLSTTATTTVPRVICIGGCVIDISAYPRAGTRLLPHTSNPGQVKVSFGGVARNCLELLSRQLEMNSRHGHSGGVHFVSALQHDSFGTLLQHHLTHDLQLDMRTSVTLFHPSIAAPSSSSLLSNNGRTAVYNCMIDETGEMVTAVADMDILESELTPDRIRSLLSSMVARNEMLNQSHGAPPRTVLLFVDGNVSAQTLKAICQFTTEHNSDRNKSRQLQFSVFFEPTSVAKCVRPIQANCLSQIMFMKPNEDELTAMVDAILQSTSSSSSSTSSNQMSVYDRLKLLILNGAHHIFLTRGKYGVIHAYCRTHQHEQKVFYDHYPAIPVPAERRVNVTGCGDNFASGLIYGISNGYSIQDAIHMGLRASFLTIQCEQSVHPDLNVKFITTKQPEEDYEEHRELMEDDGEDGTGQFSGSLSEDL